MKIRFLNTKESSGNLRVVVSLLAVLALALCSAIGARAQVTTADVRGTVTDEQGAAIAGAEVTITNVETSFSRTVTTGSDGLYNFPELPLGLYKVRATHAGFKSSEQTGIVLHASDSVVINVGLKVGAVSEQVTVEASAIQVDTTNGELSGLINGQQVTELPLNGRNYMQLVLSVPGVAAGEGFSAQGKGLKGGSDLSISGGAVDANLWMVDGAHNNDVGSNRTILVFPSVDAIDEFKIERNSYSSQFGQSAGAQISIITKRGTNEFHGDVYYFGRNDKLNAFNTFAKNNCPATGCEKNKLRRNDFGYTVGGPIKKDKIFFFWSQEWNKEKRARVRAFQVPTAAELQGDFRDLAACPSQIPKDPANGGAPFTFNGQTNVMDPARLSPAGTAFLSQLAAPNRNNPCGINWVQGVTIPVDWREENVRGDVNITKSTVLTLRYTQDSWKNPLHSDEEGGLWGEQAYPSLSGNWDQPGKVAIAKLTTTIGSSATNDF